MQTPDPKAPPRETPLYHAIAVLLVITINVALGKISTFMGVVILPISGYVVVMFVVRMMAPWYIKRRMVKYLVNNNDEASVDELLGHLLVKSGPIHAEENEKILRGILMELDEKGLVRVTGERVRMVWK